MINIFLNNTAGPYTGPATPQLCWGEKQREILFVWLCPGTLMQHRETRQSATMYNSWQYLKGCRVWMQVWNNLCVVKGSARHSVSIVLKYSDSSGVITVIYSSVEINVKFCSFTPLLFRNVNSRYYQKFANAAIQATIKARADLGTSRAHLEEKQLLVCLDSQLTQILVD